MRHATGARQHGHVRGRAAALQRHARPDRPVERQEARGRQILADDDAARQRAAGDLCSAQRASTRVATSPRSLARARKYSSSEPRKTGSAGRGHGYQASGRGYACVERRLRLARAGSRPPTARAGTPESRRPCRRWPHTARPAPAGPARSPPPGARARWPGRPARGGRDAPPSLEYGVGGRPRPAAAAPAARPPAPARPGGRGGCAQPWARRSRAGRDRPTGQRGLGALALGLSSITVPVRNLSPITLTTLLASTQSPSGAPRSRIAAGKLLASLVSFTAGRA